MDIKDRLFSILRSLIGDKDAFLCEVANVIEFEDDVFEITVASTSPEEGKIDQFAEHRTFLKFGLFSDDEKVLIEIEHVWGWLDTDVDLNELASQMVRVFQQNTGSWLSSEFFVGMRENSGEYLLTLNSSDCYLTKWSDEDIRELLSQRIFNLGTAFMAYDPSLTAFRNYHVR